MSELIDPAHQSRDLRLIHKAVKSGWKLPQKVLDELPEMAWSIAKSEEQSPRDRLAAMKLLATIKQQVDKSAPQPVRKVRHVHTVEPITDANFAERKLALLDRANRVSNDAGGTGGDRATDAGDGIG